MRTPMTALLWELWRHSRFYLASIVLFSSIAGAALLVGLVDADSVDARVTFAALLAASLAWFSYSWTTTVQERQGFISALGFTRPIRTWMVATVPMVYVGLTSAAAYLVPMIVLKAAFGVPDLHIQLAVLVGVLSMLAAAPYWGTRSRALRALASAVVWAAVFLHYQLRAQREGLPPEQWLEMFRISPAEYAVLGLVAVASTVVTIVGVARQRRGDGWLTFLRGGVGERIVLRRPTVLARLVDAIRVQCPVSSPTLAQLWFEVRNAGAFVVASGVLTAVAIPLFIALALAVGDGVVTGELRARNVAELSALAPVVPLIVGVLLIGVRRTQGLACLSAFDSTRAMGSARLIGLRVLVVSLSTVLAWLAIGWSVWSFSLERLDGWSGRIAIADLVGATPVHVLALLALIVVVQILAIFAYAGAIHALLRLNAARVVASALGLGLYIAALLYSLRVGWLDGAAVALTHAWVVALAGVVGALYLYRSAVVNRILTASGLIAVLVAWLSFCAAILLLGRGAERPVAGVDPAVVGALIVFMLVPIVAAVLAPWSFSRIRHR